MHAQLEGVAGTLSRIQSYVSRQPIGERTASIAIN